MNAVFIDCGGPQMRISVDGVIHHFEMHPWCGPYLTDSDGEVLEDQLLDHKFWHAVSYWAQQGERMEDDLCRWDYPPEEIVRQIGPRTFEILGHHPPKRGE